MAGRARRHRWFLGVLGAGVVLRVITMLGYRPALWFPDSYTYVVTALKPRPDLVRPAGYPMFLRLLEPFHSLTLVTAVQHLLGIGAGVLVYVTARRLRAPGWAAVLASVPSLLDAYQIELEHLLVSDTLFTVLVLSAVCLVLRSRTEHPGAGAGSAEGTENAEGAEPPGAEGADAGRSGAGRTGTALLPALGIGLLLAAATLTRTVGLPLVAILALMLIHRERGRVATASVALAAAALPILGYGAWFHSAHHRFGIVGANGVFLYAKTMTFADCAVMRPPADLAVLCDPRPPARRPPAQEYVWSQESPLVRLPGITFARETDALAGRFASLAIRSQPLDYLGSMAAELARSFTLGRPVYPDQEIYDHYEFPSVPPAPPGRYPAVVGAGFAQRYERGPIATRIVEPYAGWMRAYQRVSALPGAAVLAILLVPPAVGGLRRLRAPRSGAGRSRGAAEWVPPWTTAVVLLVMPAAVAEFDYRYVLPAVPLACLAAALAVSKPSLTNIPRNVRI
ncbi:hypothetical protein GCM10017673_17090 [Streptosporangium violaceochromogenes]|nr:hypothetical protein GCM10017673_17090 [Streptosporangium violaceochromogenes]